MTRDEAYKTLDAVISGLALNRKDHETLATALTTLMEGDHVAKPND